MAFIRSVSCPAVVPVATVQGRRGITDGLVLARRADQIAIQPGLLRHPSLQGAGLQGFPVRASWLASFVAGSVMLACRG